MGRVKGGTNTGAEVASRGREFVRTRELAGVPGAQESYGPIAVINREEERETVDVEPVDVEGPASSVASGHRRGIVSSESAAARTGASHRAAFIGASHSTAMNRACSSIRASARSVMTTRKITGRASARASRRSDGHLP